MNLTKLTLGERIVLAVGALLIVDLLFLPWYSVDFGGLITGIDTTRTAVQSPNSGYGLIALIVTVVMVGQIVASKLMSARLPDPPIPWSQIHLIAAALVLGVLVGKLIAETDFLGFGAYLGLALGAALAFGGYTIMQEGAARA